MIKWKLTAFSFLNLRLFTVPYFSVRSFSSTGPSSWSLDASKTEERTKCPWVGVVGLIAWGERAEKIGRL